MPGDDDRAPFFDAEPPHWLARGLAAVVLALVAAAAIASVVITLPDTVSSTFMLVPAHGTDPIRAPRAGVIGAVRAADAQAVRAGEALFVIRSAAIGDRTAELRSLETQLAGADDSRRNARQRYESQRRADDEEARRLTERVALLGQKLGEQRALRDVRETRYRRELDIQQNEIDIGLKEIEFKKTQHETATELVTRMEPLYRAGMLSWLEYSNRRLEATKLAVERQQLERVVENARLKVTQLRAEHESQEIEWKLATAALDNERRDAQGALAKLRQERGGRDAEQRELERRLDEDSAKARIRTATLREELTQSQGSEVSVAAPCSGTVVRLLVNAQGAVVQDGDVLADLACGGDRLQAEVSVPPSGAGQIKPGQVVRLLYDAFPYQRYGIRYARVHWVSPASVSVKDRPVFRVLADVDEQAVRVKGELRPLIAGMGGRADVVIGRRSLISYAFEPIRQLHETLADRAPSPGAAR
ncbi:MAG TPA: HlyD family efflux transporter periplasmic adaptor subunit [Gaiellales bacterium]|nr:HlyD family efflux transporter periplasmic adaptor subunit [Gaiellales bacterium]